MKDITLKDVPYHSCETIDTQSVDYFLQLWVWKYKKILVLGESPALNGWVLSGRAFYTISGKLVASGKRFNELFAPFGFGIEDVSFSEICKCIVGKERNLLKSCTPKCAEHLLRQIAYCEPELIIILWKHTLALFEKMYSTACPFGELIQIDLWDKNYNLFSLYHPSPIHPKSMGWNKELLKVNQKKLQKIFASL